MGTPVIAAAILLGAGACTDRSEPEASSPVTTAAPSSPMTTATVVATTPAAPTAPPPTTVATSTTSTSPAAAVIRRPFVDPSVCTPVSTREVDPAQYLAKPFALGNPDPVPVQAFADPELGAAGPFAVVLRIPTSRIPEGREPTIVNGVPTYVGAYPNGNGDASWALPDGSFGYVRARDLDEVAIVEVVRRLAPRPADAPIPGFDVAPAAGPDSLTFVAEHLTSDLLGRGSRLTCEVDRARFYVVAISGDPIAQYLSVADTPGPLAVAPNGEGVLMITGPRGVPGAPTMADVREADPAEWAALLDADSR